MNIKKEARVILFPRESGVSAFYGVGMPDPEQPNILDVKSLEAELSELLKQFNDGKIPYMVYLVAKSDGIYGYKYKQGIMPDGIMIHEFKFPAQDLSAVVHSLSTTTTTEK